MVSFPILSKRWLPLILHFLAEIGCYFFFCTTGERSLWKGSQDFLQTRFLMHVQFHCYFLRFFWQHYGYPDCFDLVLNLNGSHVLDWLEVNFLKNFWLNYGYLLKLNLNLTHYLIFGSWSGGYKRGIYSNSRNRETWVVTFQPVTCFAGQNFVVAPPHHYNFYS